DDPLRPQRGRSVPPIAPGGNGQPPHDGRHRQGAPRVRNHRARDALTHGATDNDVHLERGNAAARTLTPQGDVMPVTRRDFLKSTAAVGAGLAAAGAWPRALIAQSKEPIKIGVLHSLSGTMAISEVSLRDVVLMAVEEINAKGGVLGRKLQPVVVDPAWNGDLCAEKAKQLLLQEKTPVVFGCWTSVSRKSVLPVFENNNGLLFYPVHYES